MNIRVYGRMAIAAALIIVMLPAVSTAKRRITGITGTVIARLTGPKTSESINDTLATGKVGGADLGVMFNYNGRVHFVFGDTFSGLSPEIGGDWRSNTMAYSTDNMPTDGITFDGWANKWDNMAQQVIHHIGELPLNKTWHYIPTGAIIANGFPYVWYMVASEPPNGVDHGGLATIMGGDGYLSMPLIDQPNVYMRGGGNFAQMAGCYRSPKDDPNDANVYVFGTTSGRSGGVKLARVAQLGIMDSNKYEYYNGLDMYGNPMFGGISEDKSPLIVPGPVGEFSVMYNEYLENYTMFYVAYYSGGYYGHIRQADKPWGPWSAPVRATVNAAGWYAPFMNPAFTENRGEAFYYVASYWVDDTYAAFWCKATLTTESFQTGCGY